MSVDLKERRGDESVQSAQRKSLADKSAIVQANKNIKN